MSPLVIGMRNIGRNRRRTLVTTAAMAFAGAVMVFYGGLLEGFMATMERNALLLDFGDLQVHAEGYRRDPDLYTRIPEATALSDELAQAGLHAAPRLYAFGLAAAGKSSAGVNFRGLDVAREARVTRLHDHLTAGAWLDSAAPTEVVLGKHLARTLHVTVGDEVVVLSQAADGSMANALYTVRGVLAGVGGGVDRGGFFMTEAAFRELFVISEGAHEIAAVRVDRHADLEAATARAAALAPGLETRSWRALQPVLAQMMDTSVASQAFLLIITYLAVAMVVLNATLMSVFERIREFGVMRALGVSSGGVLLVVLAEVLTQALVAMALAVGLGGAASAYFETRGLDLSGIAGAGSVMGISIDPVWYTYTTPTTVLAPAISLVVVVLLAALYPGLKAALVSPVEAMRHV